MVLLDMDGVLLDLRFDNWFWKEHVPAQYAMRRGISEVAARSRVLPMMQRARGTLDWYCVDYWSRTLQLDIVQLKAHSSHRVSARPLVIDFLARLRSWGRRLHLVTNAHRSTIAIKFERIDLGAYFDEIVCSHDHGAPKEDLEFWRRAYGGGGFDPARALLIDDNLDVLRAARKFGIARLLAVHKPDSGEPARDSAEFDAIHTFADIMPESTGSVRAG